jgi:hypothetical protein
MKNAQMVVRNRPGGFFVAATDPAVVSESQDVIAADADPTMTHWPRIKPTTPLWPTRWSRTSRIRAMLAHGLRLQNHPTD